MQQVSTQKCLQAVTFSLLSTESDLVVAGLALSGAVHQIFEGNLLALLPSM